jgi:hypothetical protein
VTSTEEVCPVLDGEPSARLRQLKSDLEALDTAVVEAERRLRQLEVKAREFEARYRAKVEWHLRRRGGPPREGGGTEHEPTTDRGRPKAPETVQVFRALAKDSHPDFAIGEEDVVRRTEFMARVNDAYACGDVDQLRTLTVEWRSQGWRYEEPAETVEDQVLRICKGIKWARERLATIASQRAALEATPIVRLMHRVEEAALDGRDLLEEMASVLGDVGQ